MRGKRGHARTHTKRPYRFIVPFPPAVLFRFAVLFAWFLVIVGALVDFRVFTGFCAALRARASFRGPKPEKMKNVKNEKTSQTANARRATPAHAVTSATGRASGRKNVFFAESVKTALVVVARVVAVCVRARALLAPGTLETT